MIGAKTLKEINKIAGRDNIMEEMSKKVEECNEDEDILYQYNYGEYLADLAILEGTEKGIKQGLEKGMKQGLEKGIKEGLEKGIKEGLEKGIKEGLEKGMKQGYEDGKLEGLKMAKEEYMKQHQNEIEKIKLQNNINIAKKMLKENLDEELIFKVTGLHIAEIDND